MKKEIARWRNTPNETGLARMVQGERGYELRVGQTVIIKVDAAYGMGSRTPLGWHWYGMGQNTAQQNKMFSSKDQARDDADSWVKDWHMRHPGESLVRK